jgi:hypothetical protein
MNNKPRENHPWRRTFLDKDWSNAHRIFPSKKIHYEKATLEDKTKYLNYFKTKRTK